MPAAQESPLQEVMRMLPDDPRRAAWVLAYLQAGAGVGVGHFEWETIYAALALMAAEPAIPRKL